MVLPQDRPVRENSGTSASCWCQLVPSQDIVTLPVFSMQNVVVGQETSIDLLAGLVAWGVEADRPGLSVPLLGEQAVGG